MHSSRGGHGTVQIAFVVREGGLWALTRVMGASSFASGRAPTFGRSTGSLLPHQRRSALSLSLLLSLCLFATAVLALSGLAVCLVFSCLDIWLFVRSSSFPAQAPSPGVCASVLCSNTSLSLWLVQYASHQALRLQQYNGQWGSTLRYVSARARYPLSCSYILIRIPRYLCALMCPER